MKRILILEDDHIQSKLIATYLESKGHSTVTANRGLLGVEKFKHNPFDLVITDIFMPDLDGFETAAHLRRVNAEIPIVGMTSQPKTTHFDMAELAHRQGFRCLLSKPVLPADLDRALDRVG